MLPSLFVVGQYYTEKMESTRDMLADRRKRWVEQSTEAETRYEDDEETKAAILDCELHEEIRRDVALQLSAEAEAADLA